jgi:uncharacterized protein
VLSFQPAPYLKSCSPPLWARGGHAQTILAHAIPTRAPFVNGDIPGVREVEVSLPGGDRLRGFYRAGSSGVLVTAFHGLSGNSDSDYMRLTAQAAERESHSVLCVNHRGCGAGRGLARGLYHSGRGDDIRTVSEWARAELPEEHQITVGFSLSGNALLLALSESAAQGLPGPDGAIAVNPPIDLRACSLRISSGLNKLYDKRFIRRLLTAARERKEDGLLPANYVIPSPKTLWEFDELITAPLAGFEGAEDYYARCSTKNLLATLDRPTLILHALDDPFVTAESYTGTELSPSVHLHMEPHGGHVGFLSGTTLNQEKWLGGALSHYIGEVCAALKG